ncbi:MAG: DUF3043 domain-containing protein [Actinobacteria bacterium]|nr:DUF3043 domain-containing protein [Actinomycetota bacterium]
MVTTSRGYLAGAGRLPSTRIGVVFSRKPADQPEPAPAPRGKGHPTPKRKQSQAARQRPLVQTDRKAARAAQRAKRDEAYARQHQAMLVGDDRYMPARDRGRARRFARDYVDARWSIGEVFMPIAFLILFVMLLASMYPEVAWVATLAMYAVVLGGVADSLVMVWLLKRHLRARFDDDEVPAWTGMYAFQRSFMLRRFRMPKPQVKRGEWPQNQPQRP